MVADAIVFCIRPVEGLTRDLLAHGDGLEHGTVGVPAASRIVDLARPRVLNEVPEHVYQVGAVDVVPHLFSLVPEHRVWSSGHTAFYQVGQESVQFGAAVARAGQASAPEADRVHAEVVTVLLDHDVGGDLGRTEHAVRAHVQTHGLVDTVFVPGVGAVQFPAGVPFHQRKPVRGVAVDLIGGSEDEGRLRAVLACGFQQYQGGAGIDVEVGEGFARGPVVGGLSSGMHYHLDPLAEAGEQLVHCRLVADVRVHVRIARQFFLQLFHMPFGGCVLAEEIAAHVVVHPHHVKALVGKEAGGFTSDEASGTGDQADGHYCTSPLARAARAVRTRDLDSSKSLAQLEELCTFSSRPSWVRTEYRVLGMCLKRTPARAKRRKSS